MQTSKRTLIWCAATVLASAHLATLQPAAASEPMLLDPAALDSVTAGITLGSVPVNFGENGNYGFGNTGENNLGFFNGGSGNQGAFNGINSPSSSAGNNNTGIMNGSNNTGNNVGNDNVGIGNGNNNTAYRQPIIVFGREIGAVDNLSSGSGNIGVFNGNNNAANNSGNYNLGVGSGNNNVLTGASRLVGLTGNNNTGVGSGNNGSTVGSGNFNTDGIGSIVWLGALIGN